MSKEFKQGTVFVVEGDAMFQVIRFRDMYYPLRVSDGKVLDELEFSSPEKLYDYFFSKYQSELKLYFK
jgi:hypothetical protein